MTTLRSALTILALGSLFAASALAQSPAPAKHLKCTTGRDFEKFEVTLDYSAFDAGSGFFNARDARYLDNYMTLESITCAGNDLDSLSCVGFAFGTPSEIEEVTLTQKDGAYYATLVTLKGSAVGQQDGPWPCSM